jgi:aspartyl-tRNA(Asn)/glutamyl-tRNA(Gln) amidotransferase subunit A
LVNQDGVDQAVKDNFQLAVEKFKTLGFEIKDISKPNLLPNIALSLAVYYILMPAEVSSNLSRFDGVKYGLHVDGKDLLEDYFLTRGTGFGVEARRRILLGTYVLSAGYYDSYYGKAVMTRNILQKEFARAFGQVDFVLTPTSPIPAWKIGEKSDPLSVYLADVFTVTANIVGIPAISLPSGSLDIEGKELPLGIQLMAAHGADHSLFIAGKKFLGEE